MQTVSILMPAYNEERTIREVIERVLELDFVHELIVVDDCSRDKTFEIVESIQSDKIKLFRHEGNQGKTAAINTALRKATGEVCVIQDADLEYDPAELNDVLDPIFKGQADVVYGSRFMVKKACRVLYFYHYLANKFLTFLSNIFTNINMSDIETCYKAFRTPLVKNIGLSSSGFGMEVEITALIGAIKPRIFEVPISYYGRTYEEGKKIGLTDGIHAIAYIFYYNLYYLRKPEVRRHVENMKELFSIKNGRAKLASDKNLGEQISDTKVVDNNL